ncbi:hypothetical protein BGZ81_001509, partial [Podila clonocystis]
VKSTQVSDALDNADKNNDPKTNGLGRPKSNWELCESSFIEKTTTENERRLEIEEQLKAGRHKGEKYADYASRMRYMFRVYKIDDRDSSTLGRIQLTVFAWARTFINDAFRRDNPGCGQRPSSLSDFCKYLELVEGPDEKRGHDGDTVTRSDESPARPNKRPRSDKGEKEESRPKCRHCLKTGHKSEECLNCRNCLKFGHKTENCYKKGDKTHSGSSSFSK